jgi:hypothetical protein
MNFVFLGLISGFELFSLKNAEIEPEKVIKLRVKINVTSV